MTDFVAILAHAIRAGSFATLLVLASAGAASAADGVEAIPAADVAVDPVERVTKEVTEPVVDRAGAVTDKGARTAGTTAQGAQAAAEPVVRSAPPPGDAGVTVRRLTGIDAPAVTPPDIAPPVGLPPLPSAAPSVGTDVSPTMPGAGSRGVAGRDIRDLAFERGAAPEGPVAASPRKAAASAAEAAPAGQPRGIALPPAGPIPGDAWTASTLLLALTLGLTGSCRPAIMARLVRQFLVRVRIPVSRALLPAVPPG